VSARDTFRECIDDVYAVLSRLRYVDRVSTTILNSVRALAVDCLLRIDCYECNVVCLGTLIAFLQP